MARSRRTLFSLLAMPLVGLGCGHGSGAAELPPPYVAPLARAVAGCEGFDHEPCELRDPACLDNLTGLAACLRGTVSTASPPVRFTSETEARAELRARFERDRPEEPDYLELGLTRFGLTQPSALSPEARAQRLAAAWSAYYDSELEQVTVIEHELPLDPGALTALVLHELVHALQDRDHDLEQFARTYRVGSDGDLRASCVVEGEARLHEQRFWAARSGLDTELPGGAESFSALGEALEDTLLEAADVYSSSRAQVPYAHGAAFVEAAWRGGGHAAVSDLMLHPPSSMRDVLASAWGGAPRPTGDAATGSVPGPPSDVTLRAWTPLGAWGVYLIARLNDVPIRDARDFALGWSDDRFEVYSTPLGDAVPRWRIGFAEEDDTRRFPAAISAAGRLRAATYGSSVLLEAP